MFDRSRASVRKRILLLKSGKGGKRISTPFTLEEDLILLEKVIIPKLRTERLSEIKIRPQEHNELSKEFGKSSSGVLMRWGKNLQPWLLQHYAGTLNLGVEVILTSYIEDTELEKGSRIVEHLGNVGNILCILDAFFANI